MEDWKEYRLGEMIQCNPQVKLEKGKSYNLIDIDSIEIGSRYVKGKELTVYDGQSGCHFQNGDTVMARITPCLENGKIAQVQCESQKGFGSTELFVFRGTENKTDSDYVFNLMFMQFIRNLAANSMTGASGRQRADLGFIKRIKWNFPPLRTQQKIASILSAYDNLIQNYKKQIEALQTGACELYKEWFVRFRFPGYQTAEFENGIPEGWKIERIGNIGEVIGGGTPSTENEEYWDGDIPWLSPVDLSDNTNVYVSRGGKNITKLGLQKSSAKMMPKDTVLLSSRAPVGYVALAKNPICTNQGFKSVVCNTSVIQPIYLYFYFRMNKNYLQSIASGATFPELSGSMMKKLKVLLPQMELQKEFSKKANIFISKAELLSEQITNLTQQRDLLLPRLMRGGCPRSY